MLCPPPQDFRALLESFAGFNVQLVALDSFEKEILCIKGNKMQKVAILLPFLQRISFSIPFLQRVFTFFSKCFGPPPLKTLGPCWKALLVSMSSWWPLILLKKRSFAKKAAVYCYLFCKGSLFQSLFCKESPALFLQRISYPNPFLQRISNHFFKGSLFQPFQSKGSLF